MNGGMGCPVRAAYFAMPIKVVIRCMGAIGSGGGGVGGIGVSKEPIERKALSFSCQNPTN